jgi:non-heme chloroperoxidase
MMRYVQAHDGVILQHEVEGEGEPIVFLHGGWAGSDTFNRQRQDLAADFRLILRDLRGCNGSEPRVPANYSIETTELDDLESVLDAEGIESAYFVAHSYGAAIVFAFARRYPERVRRQVLIEPALHGFLPDNVRSTNRDALLEVLIIAEREGGLAATRAGLDGTIGPGWEKLVRPAMMAQIEAAAPMTACCTRALLALEVTPEEVADPAVPTLFIHGRQSVPLHKVIGERIAELRPDAPDLFLDKAGHAVHLQQAAAVNEAIRAFFAEA